jgi:glutathione synthase/RimK-type ligase-like ATP-grasp enzyme
VLCYWHLDRGLSTVSIICYHSDVKIALATAADYKTGWVDTPDLLKTFKGLGVDASLQIWDDPAIDWSSFDVVLPHTTWDYQNKYEQFIDWCDTVSKMGKLINNVDIIKGNSTKHYLLRLQANGVATPQSLLFTAKQPVTRSKLQTHFRGRVVVKPTIDCNGEKAKLFDSVQEAYPYILKLSEQYDVLIQDFVDEVIQKGEISAVMIDGTLSHVVRKRVAAGEFRVQDEHGGTVAAEKVAPGLEDYCQEVISKLQQRPLYARIDYVEVGATRVLMEVEMIEPELFLRFQPGSFELFAKTVITKAKDR